MSHPATEQTRGLPIFLTLLTLFLGAVGACVGYMWSLPQVVLPRWTPGDCLWVLGWTIIGSIQGACMAPAWNLGAGRELRGWSRLLLCAGCTATSLVALSLWQGLGKGAELSLRMASGLTVLSASPLCAYLFARRDLDSAYQASL